ncbi:MAG: hypothetical protein IKL51_02935 [Lachnospiraceae bacterium]|nr:hypothetical protein [Lachnospiraceae bacterium]
MYAPVVLFVYNRKDHMKQVLDALQRNSLVENTDLYIFSDAAKNVFETEKVKEVRQYLKDFKKNNGFKTVTIIEARENKGLEKSIITGITQVMDQYGKAVVLEDDILTSEDFLTFMNQALEYYEKDNKVWSVSGYTIDSKKIRRYKRDVFVGERASCWGWASWKDRWDKIDWEVKDYNIFRENKKMRKAFNKGGADMSNLLDLQQRGEVNSWAIRWCYQQFKEGMVTVFPKLSKVNNIGVDGSGTNCGNHKISSQILGKEANWNFEYDLNDRICFNEFRKMYSLSYLRQRVGYYWYKMLDYKSCIAYRKKEMGELSYIGLNGFQSIEEPKIFTWNNETYVFMTENDRIKRRKCISVMKIEGQAKGLSSKVVLNKFKNMSFPNIFTINHGVFMLPNINEVKVLILYKMGNTPYEWEEYYRFPLEYNLVNTIKIKDEEEGGVFYGNRIENSGKIKSIIFRISNIVSKENIHLDIMECNYDLLKNENISNCYNRDNYYYLIRRSNDEKKQTKYMIKIKIDEIYSNSTNEVSLEKIDVKNFPFNLKPFIYRIQGIVDYVENDDWEVIELNLQNINLKGYIYKILNYMNNDK